MKLTKLQAAIIFGKFPACTGGELYDANLTLRDPSSGWDANLESLDSFVSTILAFKVDELTARLHVVEEERDQVKADAEIKLANLTNERDAYKASSDIRGENLAAGNGAARKYDFRPISREFAMDLKSVFSAHGQDFDGHMAQINSVHAERDALAEANANLRTKAVRYEAVRKLNVSQFRDLFCRNLAGDGAFDDLVDELANGKAGK